MADIEKARELLREIERDAHGVPSHLATRALRALDGDGAEEWTVTPGEDPAGNDVFFVQCRATDNDRAVCFDEATAHRIARLPALEKAAEQLCDAIDQSGGRQIVLDARHALRAALNQKGQ